MNNREIIIDEVAGKGLFVVQAASGVKACVDGILLARFVKPSEGYKIADLGCGNGLVSLVLAYDHPACSVLGVDIQRSLVRQAAEGAGLSGLENAVFLCADLKDPPWMEEAAKFDLAAANPPYYKLGSGRLSPDQARAGARHELLGTIDDFTKAASDLLKEGGRSAWVYLPERAGELIKSLRDHNIAVFRSRQVLSREGEQPSLVLLEGIKGSSVPESREEQPLILYREGKGREYTDEARGILYGS